MTVDETSGRSRYRLQARIAAGGMGEVYRAIVEAPGGIKKTVAIKVVREELAADPSFRRLFVEEARVAMRLSHANIVQAFDVGRLDDQWFIAMEFVDGTNLATLLRWFRQDKTDVPLSLALFTTVEVLKGLDYAHRCKGGSGIPLEIVHRDISPANILVSLEGEVKVADFGIAKSAARDFVTSAGAVKGKIPYMAPEQLCGAAVDRRADIYSIGAVLYEMLVGRRPFEDSNAAEFLDALRGRASRHMDIPGCVPGALRDVLRCALAEGPADRYASAGAMREAIEAFALGEGLSLSSANLGNVVASATGRRNDPPRGSNGDSPTREAPLPGTVAPTEDAPRGAQDDPLAEILGTVLERVSSTAPFSILRSDARTRDLSLSPAYGTQRTPVPALSMLLGRARTIGPVALLALLAVGAAVSWIALKDDGPSGVRRGGAGRVATGNAVAPRAPVGPLDVVNGTASARTQRADGGRPASVGGGHAASVDAAATAPTARSPAQVARRARAPAPVHALESHSASTGTMPASVAPSSGIATLSINTDPWSNVYVDGRFIRATPLVGYSLPAGRHGISVRTPDESRRRDLAVELAENEHRRISLDLGASQ